jgi:hypothetical protein
LPKEENNNKFVIYPEVNNFKEIESDNIDDIVNEKL